MSHKLPWYGPDMPARVKVGYMTFIIEPWKHGNTISTDRLGECDVAGQTIHVNTEMAPAKVANTLMHEICHAIYYVYGIAKQDAEEEHAVTMMANGLSGVLVDNPGLAEFLDQLSRQEAWEDAA